MTKRFFSLLFTAMVSVISFAQSTIQVQGMLNITMGETQAHPKEAMVELAMTAADKATISLPNFALTVGQGEEAETMYVGNITVPDVTVNIDGGMVTVNSEGADNIHLSEGTDPADAEWLAKSLDVVGGKIEGAYYISSNILDLVITMNVAGIDVVATFSTIRKLDGTLNISLNGQDANPEQASVGFVLKSDEAIDVYLPNFKLTLGEGEEAETMYVGNIYVPGVAVDQKAGTMYTDGEDNIKLYPGTGDENWIANALPTVSGKIEGAMDANEDIKLTITMTVLGVDVVASFDSSNTSGIENVLNGKTISKSQVYNISGMKMAKATNGVVIQDGKKYLLK